MQRIAAARHLVRAGIIDERDILQPLYRDIAQAIRTTQPEGDITLLASPNASMGIGYYGGFRTIGTLFWENAAGLKAAAAIFSARSEEEAAALVRGRGITHIAMVSKASFLSEYFRLLHPDRPVEESRSTFGYRLATKPGTATWLQPVAYRPPADLKLSGATVFLFKVAFEQTAIERYYHTTVALAAAANLAAAEIVFRDALDQIPVDARFVFAESVGTAFYDYGADAAAARAFRRALEFKPDANVATTLAWILATTSDESLRDGRAALALIDPVAQVELNDPTVLSALAAALAEVGRFPDAVLMAERALSGAQAANDPDSVALLQRRLDSYRANRAWRQ
jgi:tetratricopeptide (TPR) repeat protein